MREMITDIFNPKFNIANVSFEQRVDCLNQLIDTRNKGLITQGEMMDIVFEQWVDQHKISKLK